MLRNIRNSTENIKKGYEKAGANGSASLKNQKQ